jgi:glutathione S-transferase
MAYRLFGSELSPYSVKVRSYFRYKGLEHEWLPRSPANQAEFQKYAKLPLVPLVVTPHNDKGESEGVQDSTPIIERFEASHPGVPSIVPGDPALAFLSALLEEYADEWGNKWMFHYRWAYAPDCWATAERIALQMAGAQGPLAVAKARAAIAERMSGRLGFVGSNPTTRPLIEASFKRVLSILDSHLKDRAYVFGGKPTLADFGLWGQLYECATDPTPGALMPQRRAPCDGLGCPHGAAQGRGTARVMARPRAQPHAASQAGGRRALPAVVGRQRRGDRPRRQELHHDARRCFLDAGATKIPRPLARRTAPQIPGRERRTGTRGDPERNGLPRGSVGRLRRFERKGPSLCSSAEVTPREMTFFSSTLRVSARSEVQQNCHPEQSEGPLLGS